MRAPEQEYEYSGGEDHGYFAPPPPNTYPRERMPPPPVYRYAAQPPPPGYYHHGYDQDPQSSPPVIASTPQKYSRGDNYYYPSARYPADSRPMPPPLGAPEAGSDAGAGGDSGGDAYATPAERDQLPPNVSMSPTPPLPQSRDADSPPPVSTGEKIPDSDLNDKDVLSGRGGGTNNHPGNKHFRQLVDQYRSEYVLSKKWAKREIARSIVMSIRAKGGRFLKKEGSTWRDIGDQKAREKTSQALREGLAAKMRQAYRESGAAAAANSTRPPMHYSPDSVSGHVHPRTEHRDPYYEQYEQYEQPYEYHPRSPPSSSPVKRRRLTYEPEQKEAV